MAELIITDAEREANSYLDWDDASIGRAVKKLAVKIADMKGEDSISTYAGIMLLLSKAVDSDAGSMTVTVNGLACKGVPLGDWEVVSRRLED